MDNEKLVEAVARAICMERGAPACNCRETGICRAPIENLLQHNWIGDQARAAVAVIQSAVIDECARVIAHEMPGPFAVIGNELIAAIRALAAPREIKVRDLVKHSDFTIKLKVIHLHNGYAWLEKDWLGEGVIRPVSELTHAENDDGR